jgi:ArsR family transcriptional regulator
MSMNRNSHRLESIAQVCRALGDMTRLTVVYELLKHGERNVGQLAARLDESQPNISKHLKRLRRAGILTRRKDGLQVFYRLADRRMGQLWRILRGPAAKNGRAKRTHTAV